MKHGIIGNRVFLFSFYLFTFSLPLYAALGRDMIAFDSNRSGNFEIYVMNSDGSKVKALTSDARFDSWWPRISPDRKRLLFYRTPKGVHDRDYSETSLWIMSADGTGQTELRPAGSDGWVFQGHGEWSPDGKQLVMFGGSRFNPQIFITTNTGQHPRQLTHRRGQNLDPSWSPDGKTIAFVGCPAAICFPANYEIYTLPASGKGEAKRFTSDNLRDHDPYFSPDGKTLAWLTQATTARPVGTWGIRLARPNGAATRWLINDGNINSYPAWSKDGKRIYFHRLVLGRRAKFSIFSIRPDGTDLKEITAGHPGVNEYPCN